MKHRITRVTTRAGDQGQTSLADGTRLPKTDLRFAAMGDVDELNTHVGVLVTELPRDGTLWSLCQQVQQELFDLGANLATGGQTPPPAMDLLEREVENLNATLPPLTEFVLPGGTRAAAAAHVCRAVCRRAERAVWALADEASQPCAQYLNRLSDLFFVMARCCNAGTDEAQWRGSKKPE
ncbi:MAG: ATP:cob(I)alamin adenosyltransferase [Gammaproteobacteria bacterium]|nr:ATP:cob(I)alamin adenosyltransferase [Gammaproteobacteria bacterium]